MYAALTGVSFVILLGVIFLSTTRFMRHQIDDSVSSEVGEILADTRGQGLDALRSVVHGLSSHPAGFYYLLQDSHGAVLGNLLPSMLATVYANGQNRPSRHLHLFRHARPGHQRGRRLFVCRLEHESVERNGGDGREPFAWGLAASIALALAGGWVRAAA